MSKHTYLGANTELTSTFAQHVDLTNRIAYDMGMVVMTSAMVAQPNTTNGGATTGNSHLEGILSANTLVTTTLRGGTVSTPAPLNIVSNTVINPASGGTLTISANTNTFTNNANNNIFSGNVSITGGSTKKINILVGNTYLQSSNTTINSNTVSLNSNTITISSNNISITGSTNFASDITFNGALNTFNNNVVLGSNTTDTLVVHSTTDFNGLITFNGTLNTFNNNVILGSNTTDTLVVNSTTDFNGPVNVDGIFSSTANVTFGGNLNTFDNNVILGSNTTDTLVVNSTTDFNGPVNVDGIFSSTANTLFNGALNTFNNNVILGSNTTDTLVVNSTTDFNGPITFNGALNTFNNNVILGSNTTDTLVVNSTTDFNGPVNIDGSVTFNGIFSSTANTLFNGALNTFDNNVVLGSNTTDTLIVNSATDFNGPVNIDGILAVNSATDFNGSTTFNGALNTFNNNVVLGSNSADTITINGYVNSPVIPSSTSVNLGSISNSFGLIYGTSGVFSSSMTSNSVILTGSATKLITAKSANTTYFGLDFIVTNSLDSNLTPLKITQTDVKPGSNTTFDLGSSVLNWRNFYTKDVFVANNHTTNTSITNGLATFNGVVDLNSSLTVDGLSIFGANVDINSSLSVSSNSVFESNLSIGGDLTVLGNINFSSNVVVSLSESIIEDLTVTNSMILDPLARIQSNLIPGPTKTLGDATNKWDTVYATTLDGNLSWTKITSKPSPVITLAGDLSGTVTLTSLGNGTLTATVSDNSHNHTVSNISDFSSGINSHLQSLDVLILDADLGSPTVQRGLYVGSAGSAKFVWDAVADTWSTAGDSITASAFIGNSSSATILQTSRTINGISFDGSANITVPVSLSNRVTNESGHIVFTSITATGNQSLYTNTNIRINPSTSTISALSFDSTSDYNLKKNIRKIENSLEKINKINGYTFEFKNGSGLRSAGVIAQEIEEVLPEVVTTSEMGVKSVAYGNIISLLIESIKELNEKINALEANSSKGNDDGN